MNALPLLRLEDVILPWLLVGGGVFVALFVGMFFVNHDRLKRILSVVVGLNILLVGGVLAYMALSTISVCLSGQASTPAASKLLQNYEKSGWLYLLPVGVMGLMGLFFAWMGALFLRPTGQENS